MLPLASVADPIMAALHHRVIVEGSQWQQLETHYTPLKISLYHYDHILVNAGDRVILGDPNGLFMIHNVTIEEGGHLFIRSRLPVRIGNLVKVGQHVNHTTRRLCDLNFIPREGGEVTAAQSDQDALRMADGEHAPPYGTLFIHQVKENLYVAARGGDGSSGTSQLEAHQGVQGGHGGNGGHVRVYFSSSRSVGRVYKAKEALLCSRGGNGGTSVLKPVENQTAPLGGPLPHTTGIAGPPGFGGKPSMVEVYPCVAPDWPFI
uniref:Uncharacterized protein n=1 Tax=Magnetococcus massalia (strain MO-1) TaxID=451514 RepID=A0A1S7LN18_MAGMO|nr:protein of unknown function [Candidatus Magnetococcus massalia]